MCFCPCAPKLQSLQGTMRLLDLERDDILQVKPFFTTLPKNWLQSGASDTSGNWSNFINGEFSCKIENSFLNYDIVATEKTCKTNWAPRAIWKKWRYFAKCLKSANILIEDNWSVVHLFKVQFWWKVIAQVGPKSKVSRIHVHAFKHKCVRIFACACTQTLRHALITKGWFLH